ncbi:MAG: hypothetical protein LAO04_00290 [Acidobacteriia bacterium]|nr:hypothetical protein [Terriglobia bacterium]
MKLQTILMAIALGVARLAAPAAAQQEKEPPKASNARFGDPSSTARIYQGFLYGVIKELNEKEMILTKTKFGTDQTLKLGKKTKFIRDGKTSSLDQFKMGDEVWVDVQKEKKTGDLTAKKVVTGADVMALP